MSIDVCNTRGANFAQHTADKDRRKKRYRNKVEEGQIGKIWDIVREKKMRGKLGHRDSFILFNHLNLQ